MCKLKKRMCEAHVHACMCVGVEVSLCAVAQAPDLICDAWCLLFC